MSPATRSISKLQHSFVASCDGSCAPKERFAISAVVSGALGVKCNMHEGMNIQCDAHRREVRSDRQSPLSHRQGHDGI
eukprot:6211049-Pleurochrysis_carterae.AAC.5